MARRRQQTDDEPQGFEQVEDERGRTRLDRPHTSEEAAAQDKRNAERLAEERAKRFAGRKTRHAARQ